VLCSPKILIRLCSNASQVNTATAGAQMSGWKSHVFDAVSHGRSQSVAFGDQATLELAETR